MFFALKISECMVASASLRHGVRGRGPGKYSIFPEETLPHNGIFGVHRNVGSGHVSYIQVHEHNPMITVIRCPIDTGG